MKHILILFIALSLLFSCEYQDNGITSIDEVISSQYLIDGLANGTLDTYMHGPQIFRYTGKPGIETIPIGNPDLSQYEPCFVLHVATGTTQATIVSSAIIMLDDLEVLNTSDFSKNSGQFTFEVCNITSTSVITVEVRGEPGSYLDIWIEGKLKCPSSVTDMDGNVYSTIRIGDQCWMVENLKTTKFNDGTNISKTWGTLSPAYCWYSHNINYKNPYGALYNWYAVETNKLCPTGWHVPSYAEWYQLAVFLDKDAIQIPDHGTISLIAGGKLKETGYTHWWSPNGGATNETGFTAVPAGYRKVDDGLFYLIWQANFLWSSTEFSTNESLKFYMNKESPHFRISEDSKKAGLSVRCIKDN